MQKFIQSINKGVGYFLMILMAAIVLDVTWQIITRFIIRHPSSFTEELARFLLIWIGILGSAYAFKTKAHLGIDVLTYKFNGVKRLVIDIVVNSFLFLFALFIMVIGGFHLVNLTFALDQTSAAMGLKMGYIYIVLPLSGLLMILYSFGFILEALSKSSIQQSNQGV